MKANQLVKANVATLLKAHHKTQKDLAQWCYRGESWISKIFKEPRREFPNKYLDRIADFFGLATYQLFQPGISRESERRRGPRRAGKERRISAEQRVMLETAAELDRVRPVTGITRHAEEAHDLAKNAQITRLLDDFVRHVHPLLSSADVGRQAAMAGRTQPKARPLRRATGGQDDAERPSKPSHK